MKDLDFNKLRKEFLDFFENKKDHLRLKSYSLIPEKDKSLLLINAGMAPLKEYFTGAKKFSKNRAASSQKCLRTGDIDNVGKTHRHATFFEMLGNFSFGDYFKEEAITWAWEFLTEVIELEKEKLSVTVYLEDDEAYDIWTKKIGIPEDRIQRLDKDENFWELEEGPCGPCSEIMYDRGEDYEGDDRFLEIWNLVFTQFNKDSNGEYHPLDNPNIDTGMGLERLSLIVENANNIFELDTFKPLLNKIEEISGKEYGTNPKYDESFRVIMDHSKAMSFLVYDGIIPSNEGRGYVLRRLIRRAYRHGKLLGIEGRFLTKLVEVVMEIYSPEYPELLEDKERIYKIITREEDKFQETIDQGLDILNSMISKLKDENKNELLGADAFKLYDTYGFPLDLTEEILKEENFTVDKDGFNDSMLKQKETSRKNTSFKGGWDEDSIEISGYPKTEFLGYTQESAEVEIIGIEGIDSDTVSEGQKAVIILNKTPFYGEGGGQVGDTGIFENQTGKAKVIDTKKTGDDIFYHFVEVENGEFNLGDRLEARIDSLIRKKIKKNHSATHLLNKALKTVLGNHINQAGSLVNEDRLRFDFTHFEAISKDDLKEIERLVNQAIFDEYDVNVVETTIKESSEMGAIGLFEDKYKDIVRVVDMGGYSVELCGGTHVNNTSEIMLFKIISESGIAAGVRRIEAITGLSVYDYLNEYQRKEDNLAKILKTSKDTLETKVQSILSEEKELRNEIENLKSNQENSMIDGLVNKIKNEGEIDYLINKFENVDIQSLKNISDKLQSSRDNLVLVLASVISDKILFVTSVSKNLIKEIKAGDLVKQVAQATGGNGGGRPDFAQAGGKEIDKLEDALIKVEELIVDKAKNKDI